MRNIEVLDDLDGLGLWLPWGRHGADQLLNHFMNIKNGGMKLHLVGFYLGKVKNVVNEAEQQSC